MEQAPVQHKPRKLAMDQRKDISIITHMRNGHRLMRVTASIIVCCFTVVFYSPAVIASINAIDEHFTYKPDYTLFGDMDNALLETQIILQRFSQSKGTVKITDLQQQLEQQRRNFIALDKLASDYFKDQADYYQQQKLSTTIIKEQQIKQQQYQRTMLQLQAGLQKISHADTGNTALLQTELNSTTQLLENLYQPVRHAYDQVMPFGPLSGVSGAPAQTQEELELLLGPNTLTKTLVPEDYASATTIETNITPAIQALTASLGNDNIEIFNWVRNNIEFIPSYGSLQGADYTLQTRRGNAFDQASLLISLLKARSAQARYVYGSIRITNEEAMNWVGGVKEPAAAQNLLAQGGIPSARLSVNGANDFIMLDHVWVSLNMGNGVWVDLDPSFKQYRYRDGIDLQGKVAFDAEAFASTLQSSSTVNETEGWVQNINQAFIETELDDYRVALEDYLANQQPDTTVGDLIGTKTIVPRTVNSLGANTDYYQVVTKQWLLEIPDSLRYKFTFALQDTFGGELLSHTASTIELAGKSLAVSFNPATADDEQALLDYLPVDPQSAADLPSSIPAGLMNVVGEFTLDGNVAIRSAAMSFGQVLQTEKGYYFPGRGWSTTVNPIITGEYQAIGLDYHGLSSKQLTTLQGQLENTKAQLEAEDFSGLTKHSVVGDLMQSAVMSYMAITDVQSKLAAQSYGMVYYREPSYGSFQTNAKTNGLLGTVANVEMTGLLMDMDSMKFSTECKSNCQEKWRDFNQQMGLTYSAYEHLVPEQLFSTVDDPVEGISAVKALAIASQQGQRIYTFTQDNLSYLSDLTVDQGTKDEIQTQVRAGKVATVHQHPITYAGWTGVGYTIIDPETGAGGFKLSGGVDGGEIVGLSDSDKKALTIFGLIGLATLATVGIAAAIYFAAVYHVILINVILFISGVDLGISTFNVFTECEQIDAINILVGMYSVELLLKVGRFAKWFDALMFPATKLTIPGSCS
jgi:transglutaminase-like putative cysteine protease